MNRDEAEQLINDAIDQLIQNDGVLLDLKLCERALQFRIAHYMAQSELIRPPLTLDCEYNRHFLDEKRLELIAGDDAKRALPDIVVHERNVDENNMLVIEIKRPGQKLAHDEGKLRAYRDQLNYRHAAHLIIGHDRQSNLVREIKWVET